MKLLILGPSWKRNKSVALLPAIERYDGIFYRITRKNACLKNTTILILTEDLKLIDSSEKISYVSPKNWAEYKKINFSKSYIDNIRKKNRYKIESILKINKITEVFVAIGAVFRIALPYFNNYDLKIILPQRGLGETSKSLKLWLLDKK